MIFPLSVLPHQQRFIESKKSLVGLVSGYASGKTFASTAVTVLKKLQYPNQLVVAYLPTYTDIKDIAFERVPEFLNQLGLHYQLNRSSKEIHIQGYGKILFRNMSKPASLIGYQSVTAIIDECDILPRAIMDTAFKNILARNRAITPDGEKNQVFVTGTPEGYKFFYNRFVTNANDNCELIRAKTTDNPFIPDDYVDNLKESYDDRLLQQYLEGIFLNINGSAVYNQFDREKHIIDDISIDKTKPLVITLDFNINPYNAIYLAQEIDGKTIVIDNAIKPNACLIDSLAYLKEKFSYLGDLLYNATIYGDASGRARSQGTAQSNYDLIREAGFNTQLIKTANPRVQDRVNLVNSRLKNGNGDVRLYICERNKELTQDLEQMSYDDKGRIDKSNLDLSHDTDALGYYIEYEHSIIKQTELRVEYAQ